MPIIDKEVIGEASGKSNEPLILPISELFEQRIQRNIDQYGDSVWMVWHKLITVPPQNPVCMNSRSSSDYKLI